MSSPRAALGGISAHGLAQPCPRIQSINSKIALESSMRVFQRFRSRSSICIVDQNDSIMALSNASPTEPNEGMNPAWRTLSVNAQDVNSPGSIRRCNTGWLEGA